MIWRARCLPCRHLRRRSAKPRSVRRCGASMVAVRRRQCRQGARCDHGRNWPDWPLHRWFWLWACPSPGSRSIATNFMQRPGSIAAGSSWRLRLRLLRRIGRRRRPLRPNPCRRRFRRRPRQKLSRRRRPASRCLRHRAATSCRATPRRPHRCLPHHRHPHRLRLRLRRQPCSHPLRPLRRSPVRPPCARNAVDFRSAGPWQRRPRPRRNLRQRQGHGPRSAMPGLRTAKLLLRRAPILS